MKSTLLNSIICASLLVFAIGCGKDKGGGSNSYINPYVNPGQINQQELDKVRNWYNGNVEGTLPRNFGAVNATKTVKTYNTQQSCEEKKFLGIPFQVCRFDGTPSVSTSNFTVNILLQDSTPIKNKGNVELNEALNANGKSLLEVRYIDASRTQLTYLLSTGEVVIYGINRSVNSQLNPEFKRVTSQAQQIDTLIDF